MKNTVLGTVMGAALLAGSGAALADGPLAAENFSGTLTATSDYTYRGMTFSDGGPAIQGSMDWGTGPWFAGAWASSWDSGTTANMEVDYYFGWADAVGGVDLMVMPIWYTYPEADFGDHIFEIWLSAGMGFDVAGAPYVTLGLDYSDDYFGPEATHLYGNVAVTAGPVGIDVTYGNQDFEGPGGDYSYYNIGVSGSAAGFGWDVRYHDTSDEDDIGSLALDGETVFTISRSM